MTDFDPGLPPTNAREDDHSFAAWAAGAAGELLLEVRKGGLEGKALKDAGDRAAHELLVALLAEYRGEDAVLSEEAADDKVRLSSERVWIVDPLDGTREFSEPRRDDWAVHVALWSSGDLVAGAVALPALAQTFATGGPLTVPPRSSARPRIAVSRSRPPDFIEALVDELDAELVPMGSAGVKVMSVVRDVTDAYVHAGGQYEWDSAAPVAVARAAGLHASRIDGSALQYNRDEVLLPDLIVCRPELAGRIISTVHSQVTSTDQSLSRKRGNGMTQYSSKDHRFEELCAWEPERPAETVAEGILLSRGISSAYLITTSEGDVVVNTGTRLEGDRHRERFEQLLGRPLSVKKVIFTQDHPDHVGGWQAFEDPGVEMIAQASFPAGRADRGLLKSFFRPRFRRLMSGFSAAPAPAEVVNRPSREPKEVTLFDERLRFVLGDQTFELISIPGGETTNCLAVWLPQQRVLLVGNHMGALYGAIPNLYTLRGDRPRSARQFFTDLDVLLGLDAALLLTGHGDPIRGADRIRSDLTKLRDAVRFIHDETLRGMNEGKDLYTLMREVKLPAELEPAPGRGPVHWYVRTVWEEHTGWFQHEFTSELYDVPARSVWPEVVELAGGADRLAERAAKRLVDGQVGEALHLVEMALVAEPQSRPALDVHASILDQLIERSGGEHYDELVWLETERERTRESFAADPYGNRP